MDDELLRDFLLQRFRAWFVTQSSCLIHLNNFFPISLCVKIISFFQIRVINTKSVSSYRAFNIHKVHTPTNAFFIKLDKVLKFTLKITLTCSFKFRSTTIIRELSHEPI